TTTSGPLDFFNQYGLYLVETVQQTTTVYDSHPTESHTLTATVSDSDGDLPTSGISYTWQASSDGIQWTTVHTATDDNTYTPTEADETEQLQVVVSFTDMAGNIETTTQTVGAQDTSQTTAYI